MLTPEQAALIAHLARCPRLLLLLDYDGTLSDLALTPDAAQTRPDALNALYQLTQAPGVRVAVVSGRPLAELAPRLPIPELWLAGEHGAVLQPPGGPLQWLVPRRRIRPLLDAAEDRAREIVGERPGWQIERKTATVAVHYRQAALADADHLLPVLAAAWERVGAGSDLEQLHGHKVLEARPAGANKGRVTQLLVAAWPGACPVFAGDDLTDEDGFAAAIRAGGLGILVASAARPSQAAWRVTGPGELALWLGALSAARFQPESA